MTPERDFLFAVAFLAILLPTTLTAQPRASERATVAYRLLPLHGDPLADGVLSRPELLRHLSMAATAT